MEEDELADELVNLTWSCPHGLYIQITGDLHCLYSGPSS